MLTYAAGPDTSGPKSIAAKKAASLDDNMKTVMKKYMTDWYSNGGLMIIWDRFTATNWDTAEGTWYVVYVYIIFIYSGELPIMLSIGSLHQSG